MFTTASAFRAVSVKSGLTADARWTKSATDSQSINDAGENVLPGAGSGSGETGSSCSP
jgi:hypothetical protein